MKNGRVHWVIIVFLIISIPAGLYFFQKEYGFWWDRPTVITPYAKETRTNDSSRRMESFEETPSTTTETQSSNTDSFTTQVLPNGKILKIISISKFHSFEGDKILVLKYETDLPIENVDALRKEVLEIWPTFKINVEKSDLNIGCIQACNTTKKNYFVSTSNKYGFLFYKQPDGTWELKENKK